MECTEVDAAEGCDCIPSQESLEKHKTVLWNGREVRVLPKEEDILLQKKWDFQHFVYYPHSSSSNDKVHVWIIFDGTEELEEENENQWRLASAEVFPPCPENQNATVEEILAQAGMQFDTREVNIILCRPFFKKVHDKCKKVVKKVEHVAKKIGHGVEKGVHWVGDHKLIVIGAAVVVGGGIGLAIAAGATAGSTAAAGASAIVATNEYTSRRKEDKQETSSSGPDPHPEDKPLPPSTPSSLALKLPSWNERSLLPTLDPKKHFFPHVTIEAIASDKAAKPAASSGMGDRSFQDIRKNPLVAGWNKEKTPSIKPPFRMQYEGMPTSTHPKTTRFTIEAIANESTSKRKEGQQEPSSRRPDPQLEDKLPPGIPPSLTLKLPSWNERSLLPTFDPNKHFIPNATTEITSDKEPKAPAPVFSGMGDRSFEEIQKSPFVTDKIGIASVHSKTTPSTSSEPQIVPPPTEPPPFFKRIYTPGMLFSSLFFSPCPDLNKSQPYTVRGKVQDGMEIIIDNGMFNTYFEATRHAVYLYKLSGGMQIEGIYNHTNGFLTDFVEIVALNHIGISPLTAEQTKNKWIAFHEKNKGNPYAKILQYCHSQGAIHVKNALLQVPKEIQQRVIVIAIAPAVVIPRALCYNSYNYASKKDIVPYGEVAHGLFRGSVLEDEERARFLLSLPENSKELIILEPHPDAGLFDIDHEFESETYKDVIIKHLENYKECNGQFK